MPDKEQAGNLNRPDEWFSFDPLGDGLVVHDTEEAARSAAQEAFGFCEDESVDGWSEEVSQICWGKLSQRVVLVSSTPDTSGRFDSIDKYELK
jgi:hypothetical protein